MCEWKFSFYNIKILLTILKNDLTIIDFYSLSTNEITLEKKKND